MVAKSIRIAKTSPTYRSGVVTPVATMSVATTKQGTRQDHSVTYRRARSEACGRTSTMSSTRCGKTGRSNAMRYTKRFQLRWVTSIIPAASGRLPKPARSFALSTTYEENWSSGVWSDLRPPSAARALPEHLKST